MKNCFFCYSFVAAAGQWIGLVDLFCWLVIKYFTNGRLGFGEMIIILLPGEWLVRAGYILILKRKTIISIYHLLAII
jgi:hypothetical protein